MSRRRVLVLTLAVCALALAGFVPSVPSADATGPRVSIVSDSILTSVTWSTGPALGVLSDGLDLQIDAAVCRRLNGESCEFEGSRPPTALTVINGWRTQLGSIVVIVDGYNDLPDSFAGDVELTLDTLRDDGVQHVLWVNLHEVKAEFAAKNADLAAAARRHPELRVLDWNRYAAAHPEWFQTDGIHLVEAGGLAIATWIHQAIVATLAGAPPPGSDPALVVPAHQSLRGRIGVRFDRRLRAGGGTAPLRWQTTGPALHRTKLHLLARGELVGRPHRAGTFALPLVVTDADGSTARVTVTLTVKR